jgi:hypothetical protein
LEKSHPFVKHKSPQAQIAASEKRGQLFIGTHNETLPITAMSVGNPDCACLISAL